jgi:nucleotidyltransferase substrate binding protein (TIGR01987 family)
MDTQDIRWKQRFRNFNKALKKMEDSVGYIRQNYMDEENPKEKNLSNILTDLVKQGLIQSFEFTHELAWNVIKDYATYQGNPDIKGSRDAAREGFAMGLIENGDVWMEMIKSRNQSSHTYDEDIANEIVAKITHEYLPVFKAFKAKMETIINSEQGSLFRQ